MDYPKPIEDLINSFMLLPSVGRKTAERFALYAFSHLDESDLITFGTNLIELKSNLKECPICHNLGLGSVCDICGDSTRDKTCVMVVENIKDLYVLEHANTYNGIYHVIGGLINFSKGIGASDLFIKDLILKVKENNVKEVILALNTTLEGETTASYIKALLEKYDVKITHLAHGIPLGADISFADEITIKQALEGRTKF